MPIIDLAKALAPTGGRVAAYPALKASIVLFDCNPGTRSWTVPEGVSRIRAFVVGGGGGADSSYGGTGGGYSEITLNVTPGQVLNYTVGAGGLANSPYTVAGTSSFGGVISATGGVRYSPAGTGTGGTINKSGGATAAGGGGGGAGHAYGNGQAGLSYYGGGFSSRNQSFVDGWKIGMLPGGAVGGAYGVGASSSAYTAQPAGMGGGGVGTGGAGSNGLALDGGIGGGGGTYSNGSNGGPGLVGIEVIA
jgi:hypothetical protein